jgi:S-DNA-T family DNA segregation ATPase FtsK/SpoIIIE
LRDAGNDGLPIDDRSALACAIGATATGPLRIDLVTDGPHAVIGGTTGSGKSELLLSWVLSIASRLSPAEVTFLFVDFKGGASFDPLASLPHCVGLITDLDPHVADRALLSLGAELRFRERTLATAGLRSIDDAQGATPFPRLVVLVDEYAALIESSPSLHAVFLDLAARGRSLGVHLVLCTQRPAGVVRDGILANSGLRISLRVTAAADSIAVIGTAAAASLPARPRGRALLSVAGSDAVPFQVARSTESDVRCVSERWADHRPPPRRPWCPPLGAVVRLSDLPGVPVSASSPDIPFAMIDLPELQRQSLARYDPARHGSLAVIGAAGSGKTTALSVLATAPSLLDRQTGPRSLPALWDFLGDATATAHERPRVSRVLLIDDVDSLLASCPDEYVSAFVERLSRLLRDGPALGVHAVLTAQRVPASLHSVLALCGSRILLRMPDRHEYIVAGGETAHFAPQLTPGGGHWRGHRIQILWQPDVAVMSAPPAAVTVDPADGSPLAVVSTRPALALERLRRLAPDRTVSLLEIAGHGAPAVGDSEILVGDPESWQSNWGGVAALRATPVLFDGCSVAEFRAITRRRELPPLCAPGERAAWIVLPDGSVARARLPPGGSGDRKQSNA